MGEERAGVGLVVGLVAVAAAAVVLASWLSSDEPPPPEPIPVAFAPGPALPPPPAPSPAEPRPRLDPAAAMKHFERGCELYAEERHEEAQAEFELALELDPKLQPAKFNLALVYYRYGRYVEAEKLLEEIIRASPWHGRARSFLEEVRSEHAEMRHAPGGGDL